MAAELVDLSNQVLGGCSNTGGLQYSYLTEAKNITAITVTSDVISGFTMATPGKWFKWVPDKDNTANFSETANRNSNKRTYGQTAFFKFAGVNSAFKIAVNKAVGTCDIIAIHVYTNGLRIVQGLEIDAAETGGFSLTKVSQTLLQANQMSGTSSEDARQEVSLVGEANELCWPCDLTNSEIEAL